MPKLRAVLQTPQHYLLNAAVLLNCASILQQFNTTLTTQGRQRPGDSCS